MCSWPRVILATILLAVVGGVLVWFFVPGADDKVNEIIGGGNNTEPTDPSVPTMPPPTAAPSLGPYRFFQCTSKDAADCCNGLQDGMCDQRVDEVMWAMSHNANAAREDGYLVFPNHRFSLEPSLEEGYRGINADFCRCGGKYVPCHAVCEIGTRDPVEVFTNLIEFLNDNPTEVLMVNLELNSDVDGPVVLDEVAALLDNGVTGLRDALHIQDPSQPWPTFAELKASRTRMLMFHHRGPDCVNTACPQGYHHWFTSVVETPFTFGDPAALLDTEKSCALDRGSGGFKNFFAVNSFTTLPDIDEARIVNTRQFLEDRNEACSALNGDLDVNIVYIDFWGVGDVLEVVQERNKQLLQTRRRSTRMLRK